MAFLSTLIVRLRFQRARGEAPVGACQRGFLTSGVVRVEGGAEALLRASLVGISRGASGSARVVGREKGWRWSVERARREVVDKAWRPGGRLALFFKGQSRFIPTCRLTVPQG